MNFLQDSVFFGVVLTVAAFELGLFLRRKFRTQIFNPLLISIIIIIAVLLVSGIEYEDYETGAGYISCLLTPATVAFAVPLYEQIEPLRQNWRAILLGILSGALTSAVCVLVLSVLYGLSHTQYVTLLPKSITTAIGMSVSEELGGIVTITVAVIIVTGVFGNMIAETVCRVFGITNPIAKGIGIGSASHAVGTAKAMELGQVEGAMSSLSIAVSGIITVVIADIFAMLY